MQEKLMIFCDTWYSLYSKNTAEESFWVELSGSLWRRKRGAWETVYHYHTSNGSSNFLHLGQGLSLVIFDVYP